MASLAKYVVQLEAQTARYQAKMEAAQRKTATFQKKTSKSLAKVRNAFAGLAGIAGVRMFGNFLVGAIKADDQMAKLAVRLGSTAGAFSELQHVAELSGIRFETLTMGLQRMTRRVAEAAVDTGEARDALKELGVSAQALQRLGMDKQFEILATALQGVKSQGDRVRLAMKLFDSEGVALVQTMKDGGEGIRKMREEARRLGRTLSTEQAAAATKAADAMTVFNGTIDAFRRGVVRDALPAINGFIAGLNRILGYAPTRDIDFLKNALETTRALRDEVIELENNREWYQPSRQSQIDGMLQDILALEVELAAAETLAARLSTGLDEAASFARWSKTLAVTDKYNKSLESMVLLADTIGEIDIPPPVDISDKTLDMMDAAMTKARQLQAESRELGFTFSSAFEDAIVAGNDLRDVLKGLIQDLIRIAVRRTISEPLGNMFADWIGGLGTNTSAAPGSSSGGAAAAIALNAMFPGRAGGGSVSAGRPYTVGEQGAELFVPTSSGRIIPNGGGGGVNVSHTINIEAGVTWDEIQAFLPAALDQNRTQTQAEIQQLMREGRFQ